MAQRISHDMDGRPLRQENCARVKSQGDDPHAAGERVSFEPAQAGDAIRVESAKLASRAIAALEDEWAGLAREAREPNPFLAPGFVRAALALYPNGGCPEIVTVREGGTLIGLLIVGLANRFARLPVKFLMTFNHRHQFLATPLVAAGREETFADALVSWLDTRRDVRFLRLDKQIGDGAVLTAIKAAALREGRFFAVIDQGKRAAIRNGQEAEAPLSRRRRRDLDIKWQRLNAAGTVRLECVQNDEAIAVAIEDFLELEHQSWKGVLGTSLVSDNEDIQFFRNAFVAFGQNGQARFWRMTLDDRLIAATADIVCGDTVFGFKSAYDAHYRQYAPGLLLLDAIARAAQTDRSVALIDSCSAADNQPIGRIWPDSRTVEDIVIARQGPLNRLVLGAAVKAISLRDRMARHPTMGSIMRLL